MNTESIAREIVEIKNRLKELDDQVEEVGGAEANDERSKLLERMHHLQDQLAEHGSGDHAEKDSPDKPYGAHHVRPV
jgi:hypothetical protein